jgi:ketosteroid isomerase-like protein
MTIQRAIASGDTVVVEATAEGGAQTAGGRPAHACVVLTFRNGLIISDHTYVSGATPPPIAGS